MFMRVKTELAVTGPESARSVTNGLEAVKRSGERSLVVSCARATRGLWERGVLAPRGRAGGRAGEKRKQALGDCAQWETN